MAALYGPTPVDEAIARCQQTLAETSGNRKVQAFVRLLMAPLYAMTADFDEARRLYRDARATFQELGATLYEARTSLASAAVEILAGNLATAERELRHDYEVLDKIGEHYLRPTIAANLALVLCLDGRTDEAAEFARIAEEVATQDDVETQALWRSARAAILARTGDLSTAQHIAGEAVELLRSTDAIVHTADALSVQAGVLRAGGNLSEAAAALREAAALYAVKGNVIAERAVLVALEREEAAAGVVRGPG
jgi:ATP/maltotriose-dependent transcriptional regulator MalT